MEQVILLILWLHAGVLYLDASYNSSIGYKRSEFMVHRVECEVLISILIYVMQMVRW